MLKLINGNCLDVIKTLEPKSFTAVISDPPYTMEAHGRGFLGQRKIYKDMTQWTSLDNDWYNAEFLDSLCNLCVEPNVFLFGGRSDVYPCLKYAEENKLSYSLLAICKKLPVPFLNNTWLSNEYAVHITRGRLTYSNRWEDKIPYFIVGQKKETHHPNEKDLAMCERIVRNITPEGGRVFDPFCGSGSIAVACAKQKREYVGVEIDKNFCIMAEERLKLLDNEPSFL